jgi:hypothetical protein
LSVPSLRGIGSPCGSTSVDLVDEAVAYGVLHMLRFFVHFVPGKVERLDEKQLDQPMAAHDAQRQRHARGRKPHAFIGRVGDELALAERFKHARDGAGRNAQRLGQLARGGVRTAGLADLKNRLDVVLDGEAWQPTAPRAIV